MENKKKSKSKVSEKTAIKKTTEKTLKSDNDIFNQKVKVKNYYSFEDRDEAYTNGSELIQVFRVIQALEHYAPHLLKEDSDD